MNCPHLEQLEQFANNELERIERSNIEGHLANCGECHQRMSEVEKNLRAEAWINRAGARRAGGDGVPDADLTVANAGQRETELRKARCIENARHAAARPSDKLGPDGVDSQSPVAGPTATGGFVEAELGAAIEAETGASDRTAPRPSSGVDAATRFAVEGYEIVRELSKGGQGVVYQAVQRETRRKVAIKVLREGPFASEGARRRFTREIELVAQLKHPNIISILHSGLTKEGQPFYVMEYIRGLPLHTYVRQKKLSLEETFEVFAAICDAVQYAHQRGIIHRDLKPPNILVDADGTPKVLDFGLAKWMAAPVDVVMSVSASVVGTLPYMSPEQARSNPDEIDTRTDVYALGVILYELLTGDYPYPVVGQMADVLKHIAETPPDPPSRRWTKDSGIERRSAGRRSKGKCPIDDEVQTIVLKALAKEVERRFQSAGDLAADLRRYLSGEAIEAKRHAVHGGVRVSADRLDPPRLL